MLALLTGGASAQATKPRLPAPPPPDGCRRPPAPKAAHFHVERGDTTIDIKCADDEPMRGCADFKIQLLDKVQAVPGTPVASRPKPADAAMPDPAMPRPPASDAPDAGSPKP